MFLIYIIVLLSAKKSIILDSRAFNRFFCHTFFYSSLIFMYLEQLENREEDLDLERVLDLDDLEREHEYRDLDLEVDLVSERE